LGKDFTPVSADLLGMETEHGIAITWITLAGGYDGVAGWEVDGWQEYLGTACLTGTLYDGITISLELFTIQVAMGIDEMHKR